MSSLKKLVLLTGGICASFLFAVFGIYIFQTMQKEANPAPIRFAYQNRIGSAICILAVEKNFFAEEDLPIKTYRFDSGPACAEALFTGSADIATMGDTTAILALVQNSNLTILTSHSQGEHRHRLVTRPDSPLKTVLDCEGKTIAVKKGTSTHGGLLQFLAAHGMDENTIRLIDMQPSDMPDALSSGSVDAFAASEPTPSLAEERGAIELATLGGIGNKYPILIMSNKAFVKAHPEQIQRFLNALKKAEIYIQEHPEETQKILSQTTGLSMDMTYKAMKRHVFTLTLDKEILASLKETTDFLVKQGRIARRPEFLE